MPAVRLSVHVTPRSARDEVSGFADGVLRVRVTSPPVDDRANTAVRAILAKALGVPKGAVKVVGGHKSRKKTVEVAGVSADQVERLLL